MPGFYKSTPGFYNSNEFTATNSTNNMDPSSSLATSSPIVKPIAILNYPSFMVNSAEISSKDVVKSKIISTNDEFLAGN